MIPLTNAQIRAFKAQAQRLKATLKIGKNGISPQFLAALDDALGQHELVKVKFDDFKDQKKELSPQLAETSGSHLVTRVGNVVVLYRPTDHTFYGTTYGGLSGSGTIFKLNTDGTGFEALHVFSTTSGPSYTNADGACPGNLILSSNTLYGTAGRGGTADSGTIFSISVAVSVPQLAISHVDSNVVLTWPTNGASFALQSAPALTATFTNIPGAKSPYTNAVTGPQRFFRLHGPLVE